MENLITELLDFNVCRMQWLQKIINFIYCQNRGEGAWPLPKWYVKYQMTTNLYIPLLYMIKGSPFVNKITKTKSFQRVLKMKKKKYKIDFSVNFEYPK